MLRTDDLTFGKREQVAQALAIIDTMETLWENDGRRLSEAGLRRGSDNSVVLTEDTDSFIIGDRVWVGGTKPGSIAYIGETQFAPGDWAGVVLDQQIGKNDGSVAGSRYFQCEPKRGIFSRLTRLTRQPLSEAMSPTGEKTPTSPPNDSRGNLNKSMSPSLNASTTSLSSVSQQRDIKIGDRVIVSSSQGSKTGVLRFMGSTEFAPGEWCGIELDDPLGKNDGSVGDTRYFECRPKHGLFAPLQKVSRSPSSRRTMCVVHKPIGASMNSSLRRLGGSRESLTSVSSIGSASVTGRGINAGSRRSDSRASIPARISIKETLAEKQQEIDMLRKERDFERERISKAANQADNAEQNVIALKQEYDQYRQEMEKKLREDRATLTELLEDRNFLKTHLEEEKQKSEDLLFRFEEESVNKDDIQGINTATENRLKDLEKKLNEERERSAQLVQENIKLSEDAEEFNKIRTEMSTAVNLKNQELQDTRNRNLCLEEAKITLEKQMLERNDLIERYASRIDHFQVKEREIVAQKILDDNLSKSIADAHLVEKSQLVEEMRSEHEIYSETMRKEIQRLRATIENMTTESAARNEESLAETQRLAEMHEMALEKLRADGAEQIERLTNSFQRELLEKDSEVSNIGQKLEEQSAKMSILVEKLSVRDEACLGKDEEIKILTERVEELSGKLRTSEDANIAFQNKMDQLQSRCEESYSSFVDEKQKLEESVASLLASSTVSSEQIERLSKDLETREKELSLMRDSKAAEIEQLKNNFQSIIEDKTKYIGEMNADISQKSMRLDALETEIAHLKTILASKDEEIENLLKKISAFEDAIKLSEETRMNLQIEMRTYELNVATLNDQLSRAEERSTRLIEQRAKLQSEIADVTSASTNSSDELVKNIEDLRARERELDAARDHSYQLENSLASARSEIAGTHEQLNETKDLVERYRTESQQLRDKITEEIESKNTAIRELNSKERTLLETIENKEKCEQDLKHKIIEISELTEKLGETRENNAILSEKYSLLREEHCEMEKRLRSECDDSEKKISLLREECKKSQNIVDNLTMQRIEMDKSMLDLRKNFDSVVTEGKRLETLMIEQNSQLKELEAEIDVAKKKSDEADVAARSMTVKYNETLTQLELSNSSRANAENETYLELVRLKNQLVEADLEREKMADNLKNSGMSEKKLKEKLQKLAETLEMRKNEESRVSITLTDAQNSVRKLQESLKNSEKEFNEKLEERTVENVNLRKRIDSFESESSETKLVLDEKNKMIEEFSGMAGTMRIRLEEFANTGKKNEARIEEAAERAIQVERENQTLRQEIIALNDYRSSREIFVEEMTREIESLRNIQAKIAKDEERERDQLLEAKQNEIDELDKRNENLQSSTLCTEKNLRMEQEKVVSLSSKLNDAEISAARSIQGLEEQLDLAKMEAIRLKDNQHCLEKENKQIVGKWNEALEELKTFHENRKNNHENENYTIQQKTQSAGGDMNQNSDDENRMKKLTDENEMYRGQIDFLNSVIVDMQRKNEILACKMEVLQIGVPANEADDYSRCTLDKRLTAPRMFCDICDQFDVHETEDCPRQAQDFEEPEKPKKSPKKPPVERPYCDNCERFGHDTSNCDDTETF